MGDFFKGDEKEVTATQQQTSQLNPFGQAAPGLQASINQLTGAINRGPYTGPFIGDQSQFTQNALQGIQQLVNSPMSDTLQGANQALQQGFTFTNPELDPLRNLASSAAINPFLDNVYNTAAERVNEQFDLGGRNLAGQFSSLGRLRGGGASVGDAFGRQEDARARGLGTLAAQVYGQGYDNAAGRQLSAASSLGGLGNQLQSIRQSAIGLAPGLDQAPLARLQALLQGGQYQDIRNQAEVAAQEQQFLSPFNFANAGLGAIAPVAAQFGQQTGTGSNTHTEYGPSPFSQLAGAGLGLAGLLL